MNLVALNFLLEIVKGNAVVETAFFVSTCNKNHFVGFEQKGIGLLKFDPPDFSNGF